MMPRGSPHEGTKVRSAVAADPAVREIPILEEAHVRAASAALDLTVRHPVSIFFFSMSCPAVFATVCPTTIHGCQTCCISLLHVDTDTHPSIQYTTDTPDFSVPRDLVSCMKLALNTSVQKKVVVEV